MSNWTPERKANHAAAMREVHKRPEFLSRLSDSLKAKWASGTRKPTPKTAYLKASESMKAGYADGRIKRRPVTDKLRADCSKAGKTVTPKKIEVNQRIGRLKRGKLNPPGPSARGPENMWAKHWAFKSPTGIVLSGKNLSHLIRENLNLFSPEDVVWKRARCRASCGLRQLVANSKRNPPTSWKGWIAVAWIPPSSVKPLLNPFTAKEIACIEAQTG